ncbi:O-antigen polymerase [Alteromonas mediterranea 615]|uniref:O-antigen polymerase n=1 Tax=Alteromonas mediterranea 615 TaxID=1300253 RepID=S5AM59_9ALTE|nr:O-antigen polymerase [Alteromonas mediterranea 615]
MIIRKSPLYTFSPIIYMLLLTRASLDPVLKLTNVGGISLGALLNLCLIVLFFGGLLQSKGKISESALKLWGGFLVLGLISIVISPVPISSTRSFITVITYFCLFALAYSFIRSRNDVEAIMKVIIYSSFLPFIVSAFQFLLPETSMFKDGFRLSGTFSHPNIYAFYLVLIATVSFYCIKSEAVFFSKRFIRLCYFLLTVSAICLIATKTRSAWIAFLAVFFIYGALYERKYVVWICVIGVLALFLPFVQDRIADLATDSQTTATGGEKLNSYAWRKVVWISSWEFIQNRLFFGHGYDTFSYYFLQFFPLESEHDFDAHNAYVQVTFDMGFLGLCSFLIILIGIIIKFFSSYSKDPKGTSILIGAISAFMLVCYSDNMLGYLSYCWYLWLFLGTGCAFLELKVRRVLE